MSDSLPTESVGAQLRRARRERGLSVADVERATLIRRNYLTALEADRFDAFSAPTSARSFLVAYARYLGLDPEWAAAAAPAAGDVAGIPLPAPPPRSSRGGLLAAGVVVALIVVLVPFVVLAARALRPAPTGRTATVVAGAATATAAAAPTSTPAPGRGGAASAPTAAATASGPSATPSETPTPAPAAVPGKVTVTLQAGEPSAVRVTVDGASAFEGTLAAGDTRTWQGDRRIEVWTDHGRTLQITVNGHALGAYSPAMGHPDWNHIEFGFGPDWAP